MDDVVVVHHMGVTATPTRGRAAAWQGQDRAGAEPELEAIIVDAPLEPMPDQGGGHGVEDLAQDEATR